MHNIYFGDRKIVLTDDVDKVIADDDVKAILKYSNISELRQFVGNFAQRAHLTVGCVYHHDLNALLEQFKTVFERFIEAAGGVVYNDRNEILVISRLGVYDFPKGKAERGETPEQTALRARYPKAGDTNPGCRIGIISLDECGLTDLTITGKIAETYHTYKIDESLVLKRTHWFRMKVESAQAPKPQTEENITEARWLAADCVGEILTNTYASIREMVGKL